MAKVCQVCGVIADDVTLYPLGIKVLGKAREITGDEDMPDILVVDIPVKELCAYCADLEGLKHPDPEIAEKVRYYTDLMKRAVPKVQEGVKPAESRPEIDVDKLNEVLIELQDAIQRLAREKVGTEKVEWKKESMYDED